MKSTLPFNGQLLCDELMSKHTSWRVGGKADNYYIPVDLNDLQNYLQSIPNNADINWVGLGSNMLVRDGGIRGYVISTVNALREITLCDGGFVYAQAGVSCSSLAKLCLKNGSTGSDFLAGIAVTVVGALGLNACAVGRYIMSFATLAQMTHRHGL